MLQMFTKKNSNMNAAISYEQYLNISQGLKKKLCYDPIQERDIVKKCWYEYYLYNEIYKLSGVKFDFFLFNRRSSRLTCFTFHSTYRKPVSIIANCYQHAREDYYKKTELNFKKILKKSELI